MGQGPIGVPVHPRPRVVRQAQGSHKSAPFAFNRAPTWVKPAWTPTPGTRAGRPETLFSLGRRGTAPA
jgi:hypothetical protein